MARHDGRSLACYGMVLLALIFAGLWVCAGWWPTFGATMASPVGPGHEIVVNIWTPGPTYVSSDFDHASLNPVVGPLMVMIWHQNSRTTSMTALATLHLPSWPLLAIAVGIGLGTARLWRRAG